MNKILKIATYLAAGLCISLTGSCDKEHKWDGAGPKPAADNPGVYFASSNKKTIEMESTETFAILKMGRDAAKTGSALEVPLTVHYAASNVSIPATVSFAAGEEFADLHLNVADFEISVPYAFSIELSPKYCNPYAISGSTRFDGRIEVVSILGNATFTPGGYSGSKKPEFVPFKQKIYDNQNGTYTIKNFLFNNAGYSFTFSIDKEAPATMNIMPAPDCGFHDKSNNRWYFYSANADSSDNYIPCYIPGNNPEDWITYLYFYAWQSTDSRKAFWLDIESKTGCLASYCRFTKSSSGIVKFDITW